MTVAWVRRAATAALVLAALGVLAFVGYWVISGGRWFVVETPSMGTSAPVGTLLWTHPVTASELHPGEFVTVHPPGTTHTYSHRIYRMYPDGTFSTKGQITSPDPWRLRASNVIGKVEMRWWGVGWLVKAAPLLLLGGLALAALGRFTSARWRQPLRTVGASVLLSVAVLIYRPLTGAAQLAMDTQHGHAKATYIATGLLPLRLAADGGNDMRLRAGQVGTVISRRPDAGGHYPVHLAPDVPFWWWAVLVVLCFVPAITTSIRRAVTSERPRHRAPRDGSGTPPRPGPSARAGRPRPGPGVAVRSPAPAG